MTLALTILSACVLALMLNYRRRFLLAIKQRDSANSIACRALDDAQTAIEESNYWQAACRKSYGTAYSLSNAQVAKLYDGLKRGFPDELKMGTPSNPILTPNGDSARWSSLADLIGVKP